MSEDSHEYLDKNSLAEDRTEMAEERSKLAEERTGQAEDRTEWAQHRTLLANERNFCDTEMGCLSPHRWTDAVSHYYAGYHSDKVI